jgi:hypothetical protein
MAAACLRRSGGHKEMSSILANQLCPRIGAQMRGGGVAGPQPMSKAVHMRNGDLTLYLASGAHTRFCNIFIIHTVTLVGLFEGTGSPD